MQLKLYNYCIAAGIRRSNSILLQFHCNNDTAKSNYTRLQASTMGFMRLQHHRLLLIRHNQQWKETTLYLIWCSLDNKHCEEWCIKAALAQLESSAPFGRAACTTMHSAVFIQQLQTVLFTHCSSLSVVQVLFPSNEKKPGYGMQ